MEVAVELFLIVWISVFILWGVGRRWYPKGARKDHPGLVFTPRNQRILRTIGTFIIVAVLIDLWYRLTGRGQFLH